MAETDPQPTDAELREAGYYPCPCGNWHCAGAECPDGVEQW